MGIIVVLPLAAVFSLKFKRRIEETIAPASVLVIFILYLSGLFGTFLPGFYFVLISAVLCTVIALKTAFKRGTIASGEILPAWKALLVTPGLLALIAYGLLFLIFNHNRSLIHGVDFAHYGIAARDFYRLCAFSNASEATDLFPGLPPAVTVWIWLSLKLRGGYQEGTCFQALELLQIVFALPLFRHIRKRSDLKKGIVLWIILLAIPMIASEKYAYCTLSPMFLYGFFMAYLLRLIFCYRQKKNSFDRFCLCGIAGLLLFYVVSWTVYLLMTGVVNNSTVVMMLRDYTLTPDGEKNPVRMFFLVMNGLSDKSLGGTVGHALSVSVSNFLALLLVGFVIFRYFARRTANGLTIFLPQCITILAITVICFLTLFLFYQFPLPAARADELAYLDLAAIPVVTFLLTSCFSLALQAFAAGESGARNVFWYASLLIALLSVNPGTLLMHAAKKTDPISFPALDIAYGRGFQFFDGDKIFIISRPERSDYSVIRPHAEQSETFIASLYYTLSDTHRVYVNLSGQDLTHWTDNTRVNDSVQTVYHTIRENGYSYVLLESRGEDFNELYADLFIDEVSRDEGAFFGVSANEDETVKLLTISRSEEVIP